jgi:predicted  nucleic acid-binding Zn-ribbon protein
MEAFEAISRNIDNLEERIVDVKRLVEEIDEQFTLLRDSLIVLTPEEFEEIMEDAKEKEKVNYKQQADSYKKELDELDKKMVERFRRVLSILDAE